MSQIFYDENSPILSKTAARIRQDIEIYGSFRLEDALTEYDLDQLTDAEIKSLFNFYG